MAAEEPKDFAVGGGQFTNLPADTAVTAGTAQFEAGGTVNLTFPATCAAQGHLVSKVDCVQVLNDTQAKFTSVVTKSTGFFATVFGR